MEDGGMNPSAFAISRVILNWTAAIRQLLPHGAMRPRWGGKKRKRKKKTEEGSNLDLVNRADLFPLLSPILAVRLEVEEKSCRHRIDSNLCGECPQMADV